MVSVCKRIFVINFTYYYLCLVLVQCADDIDIPAEHVEKLLKFKSDIDDIGADFENLAFDVASEVVRNIPLITTENPTKVLLDSIARNQANNAILTANGNLEKMVLDTMTKTPSNNLLQLPSSNAVLNPLVLNNPVNNLLPTTANQNAENILHTLSQNAANIILTSASNDVAKNLANSLAKSNLPSKSSLQSASDTVNDMIKEYNNNLSKSVSLKRSRREAPSVKGPIQVNAPIVDRTNVNAMRSKNSAVLPPPIITNQVHNIERSKNIFEENKLSEQKQINELDDDIQKLYDLITLLRDQQKTITILDKETNVIEEDLSNRFNAKDLFKILKHLDDNRSNIEIPTQEKHDFLNDAPFPDVDMKSLSGNSNLDLVKKKLEQAISWLNRTKEVIVTARGREILLENQVMHQGIELNLIKTIIKKLIEEKKADDEILGIKSHLPLTMPKSTRESNDAEQEKARKMKMTQTRSSGLEDGLAKLFEDDDQKQKPSDDLKAFFKEMQKQIEKRNREEKIMKFFEKMMNQEKEGRNLDTDDNDIATILKTITRNMNKPQRKTDDEGILSELRKLRDAIEDLQPADEPVDSSQSDELKMLLNRLEERELKEKSLPSKPKFQKLTPKRIIELRKKLNKLAETLNQDEGDVRPIDSDFKKRPSSTPPYPAGIWNPYRPYPPSYNPYGQYQQSQQLYISPFDMENNTPPPVAPIPWYRPRPISPPDYINNPPMPPPSSYSTIPFVPNEQLNQFFREPPLSPPQSHGYPAENAHGDGPYQPEAYSTEGGSHVPFQPASSEDRQMVARLEEEINELRGIIGHLSYENPGPPIPSYDHGPIQPPVPPSPKDNIHSITKRSIRNEHTTTPKPNLNTQVFDLISRKAKDFFISTNPNTNKETHRTTNDATTQVPHSTNSNGKHSIRKRSLEADNEIDLSSESDAELFERVATKLRNAIFDEEAPPSARSAYYDDLEDKIGMLKTQLADHLGKSHVTNHYGFYKPQNNNNWYPPYRPNFVVKDKDLIQIKKSSIFNSLIGKIVDKILGAIPIILEKIFGMSLYDLTNFEGAYHSGNYGTYGGYNGNYGVDYNGQGSVQQLFQSLGYFGYGPLVVLKMIDGFTTIVNILKRNKFFKTVLVPALMLLIVAASVLFLIWWLQPDDDNHQQGSLGIEFYPEHNYYEGYNKDNSYRYYPRNRYNVYSRHNVYDKRNQFNNPTNAYNNHIYSENRGYSRSYLANAPIVNYL